jgi:CheY-like chemotaxis protein
MDHMMPVMDGLEATKIIRNLEDEELNQIPIIALTANAISGMKEMYLENGFNDFISKPIELSEIERVMHDWIPKEKRQAFSRDEKKNKASDKLSAIQGIDISRGLELFGGKTESYEKILRLFAKDLQSKTDEMLKTFEENDFHNLQLCVHSIKGMAGNVACTELFELSKNFESSLKDANYTNVSDDVETLAAKATAVIESIHVNLTE